MTAGPIIQAVTFDVGGTLLRPWPSVGHVYAEVAAQHGLKKLSPQRLNRNFAAAWRAKTNFQHTREDWAKLVDQTFAGLCRQPPSHTFFPAIYDRFAEADVWRIYDDVPGALDALASLGVQLAILSNWDERLRPLLKKIRLERYFDPIIVSCEVGFTKPSPIIFELAARTMGVVPDHILHVGDNLVEDVGGARTAGFRAVLLDRQDGSKTTERIHSLRDLEPLVSNR